MKKIATFLFIVLCAVGLQAQFTFETDQLVKQGTLGDEIYWDITIINNGSSDLSVAIVRTLNNLPQDWSSSLCFGENCFAPFVDSVATTAEFGAAPIAPGDTLEMSFHVFTMNNHGTGVFSLLAEDMDNPLRKKRLHLSATTRSASTFSLDLPQFFQTDTLGAEAVFDMVIHNTSGSPLDLSIIRTRNDLPANWNSSFCIGENCLAPFVDSVATTQTFGLSPLQPGDSLELQLHIFMLTEFGTGNVEILVRDEGTGDSTMVAVSSSTVLSSVRQPGIEPLDFSLMQNYPNPFNPSTVIRYSVTDAAPVQLTVYDILGREVTELVDEFQPAGTYEVSFNAEHLTSGVYIYRLKAGSFTQTKSMILEK